MQVFSIYLLGVEILSTLSLMIIEPHIMTRLGAPFDLTTAYQYQLRFLYQIQKGRIGQIECLEERVKV